ncbi:MAG: FCD domain-containing protein [Chloroflexota bacterium]
MIVTRGLREGDPLPSTKELADSFGASLVVIREALAGLASHGVLRRRQGRQSTVAKPSFESLSSVLRLRAHLEGIDLDEFLVCREALEVEASALAAASPDPERKARALQPHLDGMRAAKAGPRATFNEHDLGFHLEIARLSGNRAIGFILMSLNDVVRAGLLARYDHLQRRAGNPGIGLSLEHHEAIAAAIIAGDVEGSIAAMRSHFAFVATT